MILPTRSYTFLTALFRPGAIAAVVLSFRAAPLPAATAHNPPSAQAADGVATDYFGAKPPGDTAVIFAPGVVSRPERFEARIAFSRDLQECYLTETDATFSHPNLLAAYRRTGTWTNFAPVSFAAKFKFCHEPFVSLDNQKLYFTADGDPAVPTNTRDLWVADRTGAGWAEPKRLPAPINSDATEFCFDQGADGTIVFASDRPGGQGHFDLYFTEKAADGQTRVTNFGPVINSPGPEFDPCLSPDGRFLIFATARLGRQNLDLFVTYRDDGKTWSTPVPVSGNINTDANEYGPVLSPDGRFLFFVRHDGKQSDIYWVATTQFHSHRA